MNQLLAFSPLLKKLRDFLAQEDLPVYLVGGAVRDALLERPNYDLDFVVPQDAIALTFRLADWMGAPAYKLDEERDTGRIVIASEKTTLDIARFRGPDLDADLRDRDFTVNAMALPVSASSRSEVIDPTNGMADLVSRTLRLANPDSLGRDPVRALRAVRLANQLGFVLTPEAEAAVFAAAPKIRQTSTERLRDELVRIMQTADAYRAIEHLEITGLLRETLPEVADLGPIPQSHPHHEPVLRHTVSVLRWLEQVERALFTDSLPPDPALAEVRSALDPYVAALETHRERTVDGGLNGRVVLRLAGLFHDVGKAQTLSVDEDGRIRFFGHAEVGAELTALRLRLLSFSNDAISQIARIVAEHMRPLMLAQSLGSDLSRRAAYRYFKAVGLNGLDVALLSLADHLATYNGPGDEDTWFTLLDLIAALFDFYFERFEEAVRPPPLVGGRDLMQHLDLVPGPQLGRILALIEEAQAAGEISTREEALAFAAKQDR